MKKIRLLALAFVLVALAANGMVTNVWRTHVRCDSVPAPNTLCSGSVDTGCNDYCQLESTGCLDFTNVSGTCGFNGNCVCRGTPLP